MHLHALMRLLDGHPFWRTRFVINKQADVDLIRASRIREVWIDASKGEDAELAASESVSAVEAQQAPGEAVVHDIEPVSMERELERASRIVAKTKDAVTKMFNEIRMGHALHADDALPVVEEIADSVMRNPGALISVAASRTRTNAPICTQWQFVR